MARSRPLQRPPIQEAVMQFGFGGGQLDRPALDQVSATFKAQGWTQQEVHTLQATFSPIQEAGDIAVSAAGSFEGFILRSEDERHLIQVRANQISVSYAKSYESWEKLGELASWAFGIYKAALNPDSIDRLSARFINRIPPFANLTNFDQILERPPLPVEGLAQSRISDFLRRHIIQDLEGGYSATLTIGTVTHEPGEESLGKPLIIDSDVFKNCRLAPDFEAVSSELATIRRIKNELFFGSLKEAVLEKFQ